MTKLLKNNKLILGFLTCIFAVLITLSGFSFGGSRASAESTSIASQTNKNFTISLYDRATGEESTSFATTTLPFGRCFIYQWADTNKITFNYDPTIGDAPKKKYKDDTDPTSEYYDLSISIEYLQAYKDVSVFYSNDVKIIEKAFTTSVSGIDSYTLLANLPQTFQFNIDDGRTAFVDEETIRVRQWGIYRFKLLVNDEETYSDFFIIEPTTKIKKIPELSFYPTSSNSSLHNDYIFSVTNLDEYRYIDSSKLVWYVTGKGEDGTMYILTSADLNLDQFKDKLFTPLYPDYSNDARNGLSFRFDDRGTTGAWEIWCEYNYHNSTDQPLVSKVVKINTGSQISYEIIIWILSAVSVLAIVLAIVFGIRRAKKDKIY